MNKKKVEKALLEWGFKKEWIKKTLKKVNKI